MSTTMILVAGCTVFTITTLAALWAGYLIFQRAWANQNPTMTTESDNISLLFADNYPEAQGSAVAESEGPRHVRPRR